MNDDTLLSALAEARRHREDADFQIRVLLAYARELVAPSPYRLADLAQAAGMSISGVRAAYDSRHIEHAARIVLPPDNRPGRDYRHITRAVGALLGSQTSNGRDPH
jgi:hypothetical protein